jgi:hypothetical protein
MSWFRARPSRCNVNAIVIALALTGTSLVHLAGPAYAEPTPTSVRLVTVHSGQVLTVTGATSESGVHQGVKIGRNGHPGQQWRLRAAGARFAQIESVGVPGTCMTPVNTAGTSAIVLRPCTDPADPTAPPDQFWRRHDDRLPSGHVVSRWENAASHRYLAVEDASHAVGARLLQVTAPAGDHDEFDIVTTSAPRPPRDRRRRPSRSLGHWRSHRTKGSTT